MADEKKTEELEIVEVYDTGKESKGEMMWVAKTNKGDYTGFGEEVFDELKKHEGFVCEVETETKGKYNNIRNFVGLAEDPDGEPKKVQGKKVLPSVNQENRNATMYVSYAKDIFIGLASQPTQEFLDNHDGKRKDLSKMTMEQAIELVKQAKKAFE